MAKKSKMLWAILLALARVMTAGCSIGEVVKEPASVTKVFLGMRKIILKNYFMEVYEKWTRN